MQSLATAMVKKSAEQSKEEKKMARKQFGKLIKTYKTKEKTKSNIVKVLKKQTSIPNLHEARPVVDNLFAFPSKSVHGRMEVVLTDNDVVYKDEYVPPTVDDLKGNAETGRMSQLEIDENKLKEKGEQMEKEAAEGGGFNMAITRTAVLSKKLHVKAFDEDLDADDLVMFDEMDADEMAGRQRQLSYDFEQMLLEVNKVKFNRRAKIKETLIKIIILAMAGVALWLLIDRITNEEFECDLGEGVVGE